MKYQVNRGKTCIVSACNNNAKVKGLCIMCYQKSKKEGICQNFRTEASLKDHMIKFGTHV